MKFPFFICIFIFLINCSNPKLQESEGLKNDEIISVSEKAIPKYQKNYKTLNVFGKVKEIICTNYIQYVPNSEFGNSTVIKMNYKFDKQGNITEEICILLDDYFNYKYVYSHDKMSNALKIESFDQLGKLEFVRKDSLNSQGILISQDTYQLGKSSKYVNKYEKISDTERRYKTYTIVDHKKIDSSNTIQIFEKGNLTEQYYYSEDRLSWKNVYKYDKNNNKIFQTEIASDTMIWNMEFDENNREIRWSVKRNNEIKNDIYRSYDDFGNLIKEVWYQEGELNEKYSYYYVLKYDKFNNWIVRQRFDLNGKKISELTRKIIYY